MLPFIPLHFLCTHFWQLVHCNEYKYKKVQKSSWNEPYSSSFTKQSCSKMALYHWIKTESRWNRKLISLSSSDWSASLWPSFPTIVIVIIFIILTVPWNPGYLVSRGWSCQDTGQHSTNPGHPGKSGTGGNPKSNHSSFLVGANVFNRSKDWQGTQNGRLTTTGSPAPK